LHRTLSQFHDTEIRIFSLFHGTGIFLLSFSTSMALGVAFGLAMSLVLKHSSLHAFPKIESCLIPLCAYTCYFFSTGLNMSGIVSLLFCGITLKHYAYHTMSHRTQLSTKYLFATLAQLTENFIFIYLGIALFTSAPTSTSVTTYVKPLFIAVTTITVVFTRYAAVFPLSEAINLFFKHARGQRNEEIPHSYQMMLFWAGLRGAVGVALAAGFHGDNAETLRTTVLIVVVLTVLLFGGTTARMLEVLGIRTGIEDEADSSDDEDLPPARWLQSHRSGRHGYYEDEPSSLPVNDGFPPAARIGTHYANRHYNHHAQSHPVFSTGSSDSLDSDGGEVLPLANTGEQSQSRNSNRQAGGANTATTAGLLQEGKWFQTLDERYLLPIFSNATASRTFHARRARRMASGGNSGLGSANGASRSGSPGHSEDESDAGQQEIELGVGSGHRGGQRPRTPRQSTLDDSRMERGLPSPVLRNHSFSGSSGNERPS
jgi:solute carrier family 9 (sodium/hydrogen exchanger), member 6/7